MAGGENASETLLRPGTSLYGCIEAGVTATARTLLARGVDGTKYSILT